MTKRRPDSAGHETRDISVRLVASSAAGLALIMAIIFLVADRFYKRLETDLPSPDAPSRIELHPRMLAPAPQLQTDPTIDLARLRTANDAKLESYGWVDKSARIVRIPIERAMDLIAQRGLPTRGPGTKDASGLTPVDLQKQKAAATKP